MFEGILNRMKEVDDVSRNDINLVFFFYVQKVLILCLYLQALKVKNLHEI